MPAFALDDCLKLAANAGYQGVELRVHDNYHISLPRLYYQCDEIKRRIEGYKLALSVYNTYYGMTDACAIDTLIRVCQRTGVRYFVSPCPSLARETSGPRLSKRLSFLPTSTGESRWRFC